jgi:hypothetical protein
MKFNKTRKNIKSDSIKPVLEKRCREYSEGFKRRMTDDIQFVPYNPPPDELKRINEKLENLKKYLEPETREEFFENYSKRRAEYLESVKNGTNKY